MTQRDYILTLVERYGMATARRPCVRPCMRACVRLCVRAAVHACVRAAVRAFGYARLRALCPPACVRTRVRTYGRACVRVVRACRALCPACVRAWMLECVRA